MSGKAEASVREALNSITCLIVSCGSTCIAAAECIGGVIAGLMAGPLYGVGSTWLKKMMPWIKATEKPTGDNNELEDHGAAGAGKHNGKLNGQESVSPLYNGSKDTELTTIV